MQHASEQIINDPVNVRQELAQLGIDAQLVRHVAFAAASVKADTLPIDAATAPGLLAYLEGVRQKRLELLKRDGWRMSRINNIEATVNDDLALQFVFQNVDLACNMKDPCPRSPKGPAARRLVSDGQQGELFGSGATGRKTVRMFGRTPIVWLICVSSDDSSVQAEVSCPKVFDGNEFDGFSKRIWVINESFNPDPALQPTEDLPDMDFDVVVTRKR